MLLRRTWLTAVAGFVDSFRTLYEDQALYAKLALQAPVLLTDEVWANYRRHNNSVCAQMYGTEAEADSRRIFLTWLEDYTAATPFSTTVASATEAAKAPMATSTLADIPT